MKRILTSLVLIPFLYLVVWVLPPGYFVVLAMIAAAIGLYEFFRMAEARGIRPVAALGYPLGLLFIVLFAEPVLSGTGLDLVSVPGGHSAVLMLLSLVLVMGTRLFSARPVEGAGEDIAATLLGILYVAMLIGYQAGIRMLSDGHRWIMFLYLVIWSSDSAAYYLGTKFGRHRLYEKISPKKSVEGLLGGLAAGTAVGVLCQVWFLPAIGLLEAGFVGLVLAAVGVVGDLVESLLKRSAGVKDSGSLIPGHGGLLDRIDSLLLAAPALFYYLVLR